MTKRKIFNSKNLFVVAVLAALILGIANLVWAREGDVNEPLTAEEAASLSNFATTTAAQSTPQTSADNQAGTTQAVTQTWETQVRELGGLMGIIVRVAATIMVWASGMVDFAVRLGSDIMQLEAVTTGWQVVLNLTNLGFVLAIIIIAFATIFRVQSYAMKQTLWKLIVAALLVNFSLVIAGGIIDASNTVTNVFLKAALGEKGTNLSNALGNALQPQALGAVKQPDEPGTWEKLTSPVSTFLKWVGSYVFIIIFTFLMILAFLTLFLMFLMRVLYLIFLLILSPIVWLFWIFPFTSKYWKQWWSEFLRWNFFAPAVLFFIYLTVMTANSLYSSPQSLSSTKQALSTYESAASTINKDTLIGPPGGFFNYSANLFIILGLLYGGIYVANKLGLAGGSFGVQWASSIGKGVGAWTGRKGIRAGTFLQRSQYGRKVIEGLQKYGATRGTLGRIATGAFLVNRLGHGLSGVGVRQGEALIKQAQERQKAFTNQELAARLPTMSREERVAALMKLTKDKDLDMVPNLADYIKNSGTQKLFENYGQGQSYDDMEKTAGFNTAMLTGKTRESKDIDFEEAKTNFRRSYSIKDYDKLQGHVFSADPKKDVYGLGAMREKIREANLDSLFKEHPGAISKTRSKLKGQDLINFQKTLNDHIAAEEEKMLKGEYIEKTEESPLVGPDGKKTTRTVRTPISKLNPKDRLKWISENRPEAKERMTRLYNARNNLGGSLLGDYAFTTGETGTEEAPAT